MLVGKSAPMTKTSKAGCCGDAITSSSSNRRTVQLRASEIVSSENAQLKKSSHPLHALPSVVDILVSRPCQTATPRQRFQWGITKLLMLCVIKLTPRGLIGARLLQVGSGKTQHCSSMVLKWTSSNAKGKCSSSMKKRRTSCPRNQVPIVTSCGSNSWGSSRGVPMSSISEPSFTLTVILPSSLPASTAGPP